MEFKNINNLINQRKFNEAKEIIIKFLEKNEKLNPEELKTSKGYYVNIYFTLSQICNQLNELVDSKKPIREVICNYLGIIGYSSCALRDARFSCNYGFIVGCEAISKYHFVEPKFLYGLGEGISWINEDGSYDPRIFERKKYAQPKRKTVPEILNELSDR